MRHTKVLKKPKNKKGTNGIATRGRLKIHAIP